MTADLAARVAAASAERRALAEAAWPDVPWYGGADLVRALAQTAGAVDDPTADAALIAANDPADTIRQCNLTDKILARAMTLSDGEPIKWDLLNALAEAWGVTP